MTVAKTQYGHLGKAPATKDGRDLQAKRYMAPGLAAPPANFGHGSIFHDGEDLLLDWDMNGNGPDETVQPGFQGAGDCVFACGAHTTRAVARINGRHIKISGKSSIADYSAVTGYVIGDDNTDVGTDMRDSAKYRQKIGLVDDTGTRHKIAAYAAITPGDWNEMMQAAYLFDAVEIGFQFQQAQDDQFASGIWDYDPSSFVVGGHAIPHFGRRHGKAGAVSWAQHMWLTQAFVENLVDEAWAIIYPESFNTKGLNDRGLDAEQLKADLTALGVVTT